MLKAVDIREEDIPSILTAVTNRKGRKEETPRSKDNPFQSESKDGKGGKNESVGGGGGGKEGTEGVLFDFDDLKTMISQQTIYQVRLLCTSIHVDSLLRCLLMSHSRRGHAYSRCVSLWVTPT